MFALTQGAYQKEVKAMENLKMLTLGRCKNRNYENGPANYTLCCNYAQPREWNFAQIWGYILSGIMFAPTQGAYEKEAKEMENLKLLTLGRCENRTYENGPANYPLCCNYAQRRKWNFAQIRGYI